jgi:hypothetical protein
LGEHAGAAVKELSGRAVTFARSDIRPMWIPNAFI